MKSILIIATILLAGLTVTANELQVAIDSANQSYTNGQYEKAIGFYNQVVNNGYESSDLYYNLGNAYFRSNKMSMAILNYERALKLDPSNADADFNLKLANTYVVDKIDVIPPFFLKEWWHSLVMAFETNVWALLSMITFVIGAVLFLLFFLSQQMLLRKVSFWIGAVVLFISILSFNFSRKQKWLEVNEPYAVVITPSVVVKSSPDVSGTQLFLIHEGLKVQITDELGDWRRIKLSDGNIGWLKADDLIKI